MLALLSRRAWRGGCLGENGEVDASLDMCPIRVATVVVVMSKSMEGVCFSEAMVGTTNWRERNCGQIRMRTPRLCVLGSMTVWNERTEVFVAWASDQSSRFFGNPVAASRWRSFTKIRPKPSKHPRKTDFRGESTTTRDDMISDTRLRTHSYSTTAFPQPLILHPR